MFMPGYGGAQTHVRKVGIVEDAIGTPGRLASLSSLFPHVAIQSVGPTWPDRLDPNIGILIVSANANSPMEIDATVKRLRNKPDHLLVVVALGDADVMTTRLLSREGADDILTAPVSEPAMALCIERLLTRGSSEPNAGRKAGEIVVFLKAGGGVGATTLATQAGTVLARRLGNVCFADLDLQFGAGANYLDMPDAVTLAELLALGESLEQTQFGDALPQHRSTLRVLAAPHDLTPLEVLTVGQIDALLSGLRRDFAYSIIDLPSVWTQWTSRVVESADRVILVTHLTVPNMQLVKRQLRMLDDRPVTLVCNAVSRDHDASLTVKAAERAVDRSFDVVIQDDLRVVLAAVNQGQEITAVRRGTRVEKSIEELAEKIIGNVAAEHSGRVRR